MSGILTLTDLAAQGPIRDLGDKEYQGRMTELEKGLALIHIRRTERTNWRREAERIAGSKLRILGTGVDAHVYEHPEYRSRAIKVVDSGDRCWETWLEVSEHVSGKARKHVPKVFSSAWMKGWGGRSIHFMERLETTYKDASDSMRDKAYRRDPVAFAVLAGHVPTMRSDMSAFKLHYGDDPGAGLDFHSHPMNELMDAVYAICTFDLHAGNIMLRRNGDLVVTDPVADR